MGKAKKEHRKKVQARNKRIEQGRKTTMNRFREEFMKQMELEKQRVESEKVNDEPQNSEGELA